MALQAHCRTHIRQTQHKRLGIRPAIAVVMRIMAGSALHIGIIQSCGVAVVFVKRYPELSRILTDIVVTVGALLGRCRTDDGLVGPYNAYRMVIREIRGEIRTRRNVVTAAGLIAEVIQRNSAVMAGEAKLGYAKGLYGCRIHRIAGVQGVDGLGQLVVPQGSNTDLGILFCIVRRVTGLANLPSGPSRMCGIRKIMGAALYSGINARRK